MDTTTTLAYILTSVVLNSFAQISWKKGVKGPIKATIKSITKMMMQPLVIIGLILYAGSALIWILVLSNTEVSYAYPFISLGYVATTILSKLMLGEEINRKRVIGVGIIILGVIIVGVSL